MLELTGDLWTIGASAYVITTNGDVNRHGAAIMGRGCAKQAAVYDPQLPFDFGERLLAEGNHVMLLRDREGRIPLFSFPVKHHWHEAADLALIERSARELLAHHVDYYPARGAQPIVLPRPGCGNGKLSWSDVRPVIADILDDRFAAVTFA